MSSIEIACGDVVVGDTVRFDDGTTREVTSIEQLPNALASGPRTIRASRAIKLHFDELSVVVSMTGIATVYRSLN